MSPVLLFTLFASGGCRQRVGGSSDVPFCFFGGDPLAAACPLSAITPLLSVSTTLFAKSSVMSFAAGCPPCCRNRHSLNVHRPRTLDQHRKGRPFGCVYCGRVGRSVCLFPAACRISERWTRPLVLSRYVAIIVFSFWCRSSCQLAFHARG